MVLICNHKYRIGRKKQEVGITTRKYVIIKSQSSDKSDKKSFLGPKV